MPRRLNRHALLCRIYLLCQLPHRPRIVGVHLAEGDHGSSELSSIAGRIEILDLPVLEGDVGLADYDPRTLPPGDRSMERVEQIGQDLVAVLPDHVVEIDALLQQRAGAAGSGLQGRDEIDVRAESGFVEQIGKHLPERLGALRFKVIEFQLADAVRCNHLDVVRRRNVRFRIQLRRHIPGPQQSASRVELHLVRLRIRRVEFCEFAVDVALCVELQRGPEDRSVLLLLEDGRTAEMALKDGAGIAVLQDADLPGGTVRALPLEEVFGCVCHYVVYPLRLFVSLITATRESPSASSLPLT